jgi:serine/threonine-protein kinase HipA
MPTSTSDRTYVWTWLHGANEPVPAGLLVHDGARLIFRYGLRYLERPGAIALGPDLPLGTEVIEPSGALDVAGSLRDASPDAWGRQVIDFRRTGAIAATSDMGMAPELVYMLESDSNRFGAIDFQHSGTDYVARGTAASLAELLEATDRMSRGEQVPASLERALGHGTTMGGARPKATLIDDDKEYIAKFSRQSDSYDVVGGEAAAMHLARQAGVDTAITVLKRVGHKKALLVERFDRPANGDRLHTVSALTLSGLTEMTARYATYPQLVDTLRKSGSEPKRYGEQIFRRVAVNIAVSNTDDHLRNHAAFWDGTHLDLTPAYDISPMPRSGETATQALGLTNQWQQRASTFVTLLDAHHHYGLDRPRARDVIDHVVATVHDGWNDAVQAGELTTAEATRMRRTQILNPGTLHGYKPT